MFSIRNNIDNPPILGDSPVSSCCGVCYGAMTAVIVCDIECAGFDAASGLITLCSGAVLMVDLVIDNKTPIHNVV